MLFFLRKPFAIIIIVLNLHPQYNIARSLKTAKVAQG